MAAALRLASCCSALVLLFTLVPIRVYGLSIQQAISATRTTSPRRYPTSKSEWSSSSSSSSSSTVLTAVSSSQVAALDGAEWTSLQAILMQEERIPRGAFSNVGKMTILTGTVLDDGGSSDGPQPRRVVGIQATPTTTSSSRTAPLHQQELKTVALDDATSIYVDSMANIPSRISDQDAIATLWASLVGVHCALPMCQDVGGSAISTFVSGKTVVVGGNDYASFATKALAALGATVVQVSTRNGASSASRPINKGDGSIQELSPAVGELELGFAAVVGDFDALLDTLSDEAKFGGMRVQKDDNLNELVSSGVVAELRKQHKCSRYVSTLSHSQAIVRDEGVLWGPKKASSHVEEVSKRIDSGDSIVPPRNFSSTLQTLLDHGITWKAKKEKVLVRGWALKDFWELTSWPRDSSGAGDTRYGLPVLEDLDTLIQERMVSEPPSFSQGKLAEEQLKAYDKQAKEDYANPHVMTVRGVEGLQRDIISAERDCLLFLSAPWCRTCRYLTPQYTRMAREASVDVTFAKADATGSIGKALGKALEVDAVPAFILFRQGEVYGSPLSVSRLPSKKLEQAIDHLASGMEWNAELLDEEA